MLLEARPLPTWKDIEKISSGEEEITTKHIENYLTPILVAGVLGFLSLTQPETANAQTPDPNGYMEPSSIPVIDHPGVLTGTNTITVPTESGKIQDGVIFKTKPQPLNQNPSVAERPKGPFHAYIPEVKSNQPRENGSVSDENSGLGFITAKVILPDGRKVDIKTPELNGNQTIEATTFGFTGKNGEINRLYTIASKTRGGGVYSGFGLNHEIKDGNITPGKVVDLTTRAREGFSVIENAKFYEPGVTTLRLLPEGSKASSLLVPTEVVFTENGRVMILDTKTGIGITLAGESMNYSIDEIKGTLNVTDKEGNTFSDFKVDADKPGFLSTESGSPLQGSIFVVTPNNDGTRMAAIYGDGTLKIFDTTDTLNQKELYKSPEELTFHNRDFGYGKQPVLTNHGYDMGNFDVVTAAAAANREGEKVVSVGLDGAGNPHVFDVLGCQNQSGDTSYMQLLPDGDYSGSIVWGVTNNFVSGPGGLVIQPFILLQNGEITLLKPSYFEREKPIRAPQFIQAPGKDRAITVTQKDLNNIDIMNGMRDNIKTQLQENPYPAPGKSR